MTKILNALARLKPYAKAIASAGVCLAAYLTGVVPAQGGFGDVSVVQWLGAVVFLGSAYGLTYRVPNAPRAGETRVTWRNGSKHVVDGPRTGTR